MKPPRGEVQRLPRPQLRLRTFRLPRALEQWERSEISAIDAAETRRIAVVLVSTPALVGDLALVVVVEIVEIVPRIKVVRRASVPRPFPLPRTRRP